MYFKNIRILAVSSVIWLICSTYLYAEKRVESPFLIGIKGGLNVSQPLVLNQYAVFTSLNDEAPYKKEYAPFWKNVGYQYGFVGLYRLSKNINLLFEPTFSHYRFNYTISTTWQDTDNNDFTQSSSQNHKHNMHYVEFPLALQYYYDISPLKPYFMMGGYYGYLLGAEKIYHIEESVTMDGTEFITSSEQQHVFFNDQYIKSRFAAFSGIGAIYDLSSIQIMFGISYHFSFNNITRENARYANQLITGSSYDINDDLLLNALAFNIRILFPLNKPSNLLKSLKCN